MRRDCSSPLARGQILSRFDAHQLHLARAWRCKRADQKITPHLRLPIEQLFDLCRDAAVTLLSVARRNAKHTLRADSPEPHGRSAVVERETPAHRKALADQPRLFTTRLQ